MAVSHPRAYVITEEEENPNRTVKSCLENGGGFERKTARWTCLCYTAGCVLPLVEGLYLQEADSMLQLLCTPSQHRTDILAWICSSINPTFAFSEAISLRSKDPEVRIKVILLWSVIQTEMSVLGQELMLCRAEDLDLIRSSPAASVPAAAAVLVPACEKSAGHRTDQETLLNELYAAENLPHFTQMLAPTLDPWPAHIKYCEFLSSETQSSGVFSPGSLRVAACDLQMLMAAFSHVFETDLRAYCSRDPPSFSTETHVFQRIHQLLLAFIMELEMLKEVSEASASITEEVEQLQTQPRYRSRGEKRNLPDQLEELTRRIRDVFSLLQS
ncbi:hypothetical protein F7725_000166 [Dissostichus mawsoni]|uniref:HAUS augmin-like complex subunit 7 n=1 Tax=Dissostichus mawsoni TaxID=36200 RepID=A0A7J5ZFF7_DISMA|nr:hypothetical protein F7725_000166 [Dissostichus mawsoni]